LGSIPVMESSPGFDRTFCGLPVLIVPSFDDVTPELLEAAYADFTSRAAEWDYRRLDKAYWYNAIFDASRFGDASKVTLEQHPIHACNRPVDPKALISRVVDSARG